MTLYMLQLAPDLGEFVRWAERERLLHGRDDDDLGYAMHAALHAAFADLAPAPFALIRQPNRPLKLLAYSRHPAAALREQAAAIAEPNVVGLLRLQDLADKLMPEALPSGRRLGFSIRARPTVRTDRGGDRTRVRERDAYLAAIEGTNPGAGPSRGEVYQGWLNQRLADGGARSERLLLDGFRLTTSPRRDQTRRLRGLIGPDASFSGVLTVADPGQFAVMLARGVGRHRAFGFGMLLLRPA